MNASEYKHVMLGTCQGISFAESDGPWTRRVHLKLRQS